MAIVGNPLDTYTQRVINLIQKIHGSKTRTAADLNYLNNNPTWIKVASSVSIDDDRLKLLNQYEGAPLDYDQNIGRGLARNFVLFNGIQKAIPNLSDITNGDGSISTVVNNSTLSPLPTTIGNGWDSVYGFGGVNSFGIDPSPGVESLDIKYLNRGSTKKIQLKIKCFNRNQFNIIDNLYLRLGFFILIEFGKTSYPVIPPNLSETEFIGYQDIGTTVLEESWFSDTIDNAGQLFNNDYYEILSNIQSYKSLYSFHYDGIIGKITNFNWNFNKDGSYDVTIDVISMGDVIESLKANATPSSYNSLKFLEELNNKPKEEPTDVEDTEGEENPPKKNVIELLKDSLIVKRDYSLDKSLSDHYLYPIGKIVNFDGGVDDPPPQFYKLKIKPTPFYELGKKPVKTLPQLKEEYGGSEWIPYFCKDVVEKKKDIIVGRDPFVQLLNEGRIEGYSSEADFNAYLKDLSPLLSIRDFGGKREIPSSGEFFPIKLTPSSDQQINFEKNYPNLLNFLASPNTGDFTYITYDGGKDVFYIRFSHLLTWLKKIVIPKMSTKNDPNNKKDIIKINFNPIPVYTNPTINHISTDLGVCFIPVKFFASFVL